MASLSAPVQLAILLVLLLFAAFFSGAETAMMALSRPRLRHLVRQGKRGARATQALLDRADRLLSVVLLGNSLLNAAITALVTTLTIEHFGTGQWTLTGATVAVAFLILVFSEITPKIIGATYPERIALSASLVLRPLTRLATPVLWFVNLFVQAMLKLLRVRSRASRPSA